MDGEPSKPDSTDGDQYGTLLELEDLESLLEELEEQGYTGYSDQERLPPELAERLAAYQLRDVQQVRDRIMHLHARLDEDEGDLTISDS